MTTNRYTSLTMGSLKDPIRSAICLRVDCTDVTYGRSVATNRAVRLLSNGDTTGFGADTRDLYSVHYAVGRVVDEMNSSFDWEVWRIAG